MIGVVVVEKSNQTAGSDSRKLANYRICAEVENIDSKIIFGVLSKSPGWMTAHLFKWKRLEKVWEWVEIKNSKKCYLEMPIRQPSWVDILCIQLDICLDLRGEVRTYISLILWYTFFFSYFNLWNWDVPYHQCCLTVRIGIIYFLS